MEIVNSVYCGDLLEYECYKCDYLDDCVRCGITKRRYANERYF